MDGLVQPVSVFGPRLPAGTALSDQATTKSLADSHEPFALNLRETDHTRSLPQATGTDNTLQKFEAMFISQMLSIMLESTEAGLGGKGITGSVHVGWFAEAVAEQAAKSGGIGLAERLAEMQLGSEQNRDRE